jgi:pseudoazurin
MVSAAQSKPQRLARSLSPEFGAEIALAQYRQDQAAISDTREPGKSRAQVPGNGKEAGIMRKIAMLAAAAAVLVMAGSARAAEVEVKMLNRGADGVMVFEPAFVKIAPGDSVKFVSTDKGHNAESIKGMLPEGAAAFVGKNNEDIAVKFEQEGVYGIKCLPHYGMGMVAMIVVGNPGNVDQAKTVPQVGKAKQAFATLFGKLEASKTASR